MTFYVAMSLALFVFLNLTGQQMEVSRKSFKMALGFYFAMFVDFQRRQAMQTLKTETVLKDKKLSCHQLQAHKNRNIEALGLCYW